MAGVWTRKEAKAEAAVGDNRSYRTVEALCPEDDGKTLTLKIGRGTIKLAL